MSASTEAFVYGVLRTMRGRGRDSGSLDSVKPVSLVVGLLDEMGGCNPGFDPLRVDDVILAVVLPVGDQGANLARTSALAAAYESSGAGFQLNRFCRSGRDLTIRDEKCLAEGDSYRAHAGEAVAETMVALGRPGRLRGAGFYDYDGSGRRTGPWQRLATTFPAHGDPARTDLHELIERLLFAEAVEVARCVAAGVLTSVTDPTSARTLPREKAARWRERLTGHPHHPGPLHTPAAPPGRPTSNERSPYDRRRAVHRPVRGKEPQGIPDPEPARSAQRDQFPYARRHRGRRPARQ